MRAFPAFRFPALLSAVLLAVLLAGAPGAARADFAAGVKAYDAGDFKAAFEAWLPLARDNDPAAQRNVAHLYRKGLGVPQDFAAAAEWYRRAADNGLARAQANLASMYLRGQGLERDARAAREWFARAAVQGHPVAQFNLGLLYERGEGAPRSLPHALGWYALAARSGHQEALGRLSVLVLEEERRRLKATQAAREAARPAPVPASGTAPAGSDRAAEKDELARTIAAATEDSRSAPPAVPGGRAPENANDPDRTGTPPVAGETAKTAKRKPEDAAGDAEEEGGTLLAGLFARLSRFGPSPAEPAPRQAAPADGGPEAPDPDEARVSVALAAGEQALRGARYDEARNHWLPAARRGVAEARFRLGRLYGRKDYSLANPVEQYFWLSLAARQGHIGASIARQEALLSLSEESLREGDRRVEMWLDPAGTNGER